MGVDHPVVLKVDAELPILRCRSGRQSVVCNIAKQYFKGVGIDPCRSDVVLIMRQRRSVAGLERNPLELGAQLNRMFTRPDQVA